MKIPPRPRILVPILGGDIGPATLARARAFAKARGARLVLVHVLRGAGDIQSSPTSSSIPDAGPRWRLLAASGPVFVDAVAGEPTSVILSQADRFASDVVLLGRPEEITAENAWIAAAADRIRRAAPARTEIITEPAAPSRSRSVRTTSAGNTGRTTSETHPRIRTMEAVC